MIALNQGHRQDEPRVGLRGQGPGVHHQQPRVPAAPVRPARLPLTGAEQGDHLQLEPGLGRIRPAQVCMGIEPINRFADF